MRLSRTSVAMIRRLCPFGLLSIAMPLAITLAQAGTYLPGAKTGAAVGSPEVFMAFMVDHDAGCFDFATMLVQLGHD